MTKLHIPHNTTRMLSAASVKAARRAVVTHAVVKPNPAIGALIRSLKKG
jgi:hypothetical protein